MRVCVGGGEGSEWRRKGCTGTNGARGDHLSSGATVSGALLGSQTDTVMCVATTKEWIMQTFMWWCVCMCVCWGAWSNVVSFRHKPGSFLELSMSSGTDPPWPPALELTAGSVFPSVFSSSFTHHRQQQRLFWYQRPRRQTRWLTGRNKVGDNFLPRCCQQAHHQSVKHKSPNHPNLAPEEKCSLTGKRWFRLGLKTHFNN